MVTYTIMAALQAGLTTLLEYLSAHVLTCLIPAFFIAGAIAALLQNGNGAEILWSRCSQVAML